MKRKRIVSAIVSVDISTVSPCQSDRLLFIDALSKPDSARYADTKPFILSFRHLFYRQNFRLRPVCINHQNRTRF